MSEQAGVNPEKPAETGNNPMAVAATEAADRARAALMADMNAEDDAGVPAEVTDASKVPEATTEAARAAAEFKALVAKLEGDLNNFDDLDVKRMSELLKTPGILALLSDVKPDYIEIFSVNDSDETPPATAVDAPKRSVARKKDALPKLPAGERTNLEESPFQNMDLKEFKKVILLAVKADPLAGFIFQTVDEKKMMDSPYLRDAWAKRGDLAEMQAALANGIANLLDAGQLRVGMSAQVVEAITSQDSETADRIVQRLIENETEAEVEIEEADEDAAAEVEAEAEDTEDEEGEQPKRGLGSLLKSIAGAPGKGIRRALAGVRSYYNRSVEMRVNAMSGRRSAESSESEIEEEKEYSQAELTRFEEFTEHVRKPRVRKHIAAQLKALEAENALPDVRGGSTAATAAAEALTPTDATRRQAILEKIAEARAMLRDLRVPDADFGDEDEINPEELIHLLELLDALQVSIDPKKKDAKTIDDFMPDAPTPEEPEEEAEAEEEPTTETKVGFWRRLKFWDRDKKEAQHHVEEVLDFDYVDQQLKTKAKELHPAHPNFKKIRNALNKAVGLLAQLRLAANAENVLQRDPRAVKQLRETLISLGIAESAQTEQAAADDAEAEARAVEAVDNAELSQGKKKWLKKKLQEIGGFLRSPAFLLGVAAGAATDLLLHTMGADPQNKAWIKTIVAALAQDSSETQYLKAQALQIGAAGGLVGMASMGWFRLHDRATQMVGRNVLKFMVGFGGGAIGMHLGHTAFDNSQFSGPDMGHSPVVIDVDEQPPAVAPDLDAESPVLGDDQSEANPHVGQIKPDAGLPVDDSDAPPTAKAPTIEPAAAQETVAVPTVTPEMKAELEEGVQRWQDTLSKWWGGLLSVAREQTAKQRDAQTAAPIAATTAEPENPFYAELNAERAKVDPTANVHDGSSSASNAEAAAAAPAAQVHVSSEHAQEAAHATVVAANPVAEQKPETPAAAPATQVHVSSEHAQEAAHATVVAAAPVVEQQPPAVEVEVVKFDSEHIWAEAAQITGGDLKRTDFLKDVGVMFDHAGTGNHEHRMGDSVIVITDSVHTAADLQKLHDLHPEAVGFTLPDESLRKLDAFYQEALNTEPSQRNTLQQDVIEHFTGGTPGADLAKNPQAVEAMLKIAHGETVDGSQHIIGSAAEQVVQPVENDGQPTQQTAKEILDAAVQEHNLALKHPLVGQGVIDHLMHELPDNKIDHPELIASFVDSIWDKWVEGCHKSNLDPMQESPKIVDYIKNPSYDGTDPLSVSPVRATIIEYIQHGNSMPSFTMERGDGQTINLNLDMAHSVLKEVDDNPFIGQLMANNGADSATAQLNIQKVFADNADAYYKQVQNKQTP
ncbi:hypothetical protein KA078_03180 [Candidatus Woesebacteria bacterium]|nr:hypothetical protein [Candidatus Woesebacteria bacterium]